MIVKIFHELNDEISLVYERFTIFEKTIKKIYTKIVHRQIIFRYLTNNDNGHVHFDHEEPLMFDLYW